MTHLTREQILARKLGRETVELMDGSTVQVRGMSRNDAAELAKTPEGAERDAVMMSMGLVEPELTPEDCRALFVDGMNGDVLIITGKILELSGMAPGQAKDATKSVSRGRKRR